jgi:hypothetical protein
MAFKHTAERVALFPRIFPLPPQNFSLPLLYSLSHGKQKCKRRPDYDNDGVDYDTQQSATL